MANIFDLVFGMKVAVTPSVILTAEDEYISRLARDLDCSVESLRFLVSANSAPLSELEIPRYRRAS